MLVSLCSLALFNLLLSLKIMRSESFKLENFEGPLDFLLHLIQKKEIDIYQVSLKQITDQYLNRLSSEASLDVESGAEVIGQTAFLLWLKSKTLLPKHEQETLAEEELDPRFDVIHKLIEYCCFKEAAKNLSEREQQSANFYYRGEFESYEPRKPLGVDHLTLEDLTLVFRNILEKRQHQQGTISEEEWRVADKIKLIRDLLKRASKILFNTLFMVEMSKDELIVTFLAVLELMKLNEIKARFDAAVDGVILINGEAS